jgi:hypothetical protein
MTLTFTEREIAALLGMTLCIGFGAMILVIAISYAFRGDMGKFLILLGLASVLMAASYGFISFPAKKEAPR